MTQLNELKTELASLRVQKIAGGSASKLGKMYVVFGLGRGLVVCGRAVWSGLVLSGREGAGLGGQPWRNIGINGRSDDGDVRSMEKECRKISSGRKIPALEKEEGEEDQTTRTNYNTDSRRRIVIKSSS